jgi:putative flippase GtrA
VIIPAYQPGDPLLRLIGELAVAPTVSSIVVVNDGSSAACDATFAAAAAQPRTTVLRHAVNLGKGAALQTGLNHVLCACPADATPVTADADGQHRPDDILAVAREGARCPRALVMGARTFGTSTPFRSRLGNTLTRHIMRLAVGARIRDTQTGLRAIPRELIPALLRLSARGYEFELDMLLVARQRGFEVREVPIQTVYEPGNPSSHFDPLLDSMRIYFVLLRFTLAAILTAILDYSIFTTVLAISDGTARAHTAARAMALVFNYLALRRMVFYSDLTHRSVFPRYLLVVAASGAVSYALMRFLMLETSMHVLAAKACAESLVFFANFAILREYIFHRREPRPRGAP